MPTLLRQNLFTLSSCWTVSAERQIFRSQGRDPPWHMAQGGSCAVSSYSLLRSLAPQQCLLLLSGSQALC